MKKYLLLITASLLIAAGCANQQTPASSQNPSSTSQPSSSQSQPADSESEAPAEEERIVVADAAMYRGTVTEIKSQEDGEIIVVRQPKGVDYGAADLEFYVTEDTKTSFDRTQLEAGTFVEVFYSAATSSEQGADQTPNAIAINKYMEEAAVNFNGTVIEVSFDEQAPEKGFVMLRELDTDKVVRFNFGAESQFYLAADKITPDTKLNIFHSGVFAESEPVQGFITEVRAFYEEPAEPAANPAPTQLVPDEPAVDTGAAV